MKNPFASKPEFKIHGRHIEQSKSSTATNAVRGGLSSSNTHRIYPRVDFWKRWEFYLTVGRVQNVTESYVLNILNREWYFDDTEDGKYEQAIKQMEEWEDQVVLTRFLGNMVRNWVVNGVHIISPKDWVPMQLQAIRAKSRDDFGNTEFYYQYHHGVEKKIPAKDFLEIPYIELDREPWPTGMFDSLMNKEWIDIDGRDPYSSLELYRQALQDNMKIHHKYASPRVIYTVPGVSQETVDNDVTPVIESMSPGDRAVFNAEIEISQETVDGNARFIEHVNKIIDEIDTGLQSSANRLITEPSAMADAREANSQDDDRVLGLMERIRVFMNTEVIPRITGLKPGLVEFKWGAKDAFDLEFPEPLQQAVEKGILSPEKAAIILEENYHWKIPTDEDVIEKFGKIPSEEPEKPEPKEIPQQGTEHFIKARTEAADLDLAYKREKLVGQHYLNQKLKEI